MGRLIPILLLFGCEAQQQGELPNPEMEPAGMPVALTVETADAFVSFAAASTVTGMPLPIVQVSGLWQ